MQELASRGVQKANGKLQVQEIVIDYSDCNTTAPVGNDISDFREIPSDKYYSFFKAKGARTVAPQWRRNTTNVVYRPGVNRTTPLCSIQFNIPNDLQPPVLFYYRLTNFYQNHRRYVKSLDTDQLRGRAVSVDTIRGGSCDPLRLAPDGRPYYPCGLIANSVFNDTFTSPLLLNVPNASSLNEIYSMTDRGIAWSSDRQLYGPTEYNYSQIAVPPNWVERWGPEGYTAENPPENPAEDEALQVWMRTAGLPAFTKLARRNDNQTMQSGTYQVDITLSRSIFYPSSASAETLQIFQSQSTEELNRSSSRPGLLWVAGIPSLGLLMSSLVESASCLGFCLQSPISSSPGNLVRA